MTARNKKLTPHQSMLRRGYQKIMRPLAEGRDTHSGLCRIAAGMHMDAASLCEILTSAGYTRIGGRWIDTTSRTPK